MSEELTEAREWLRRYLHDEGVDFNHNVTDVENEILAGLVPIIRFGAWDELHRTHHIECDCVPDLGPSHCHLCGDAAGHPVPWTEAHPTRRQVAEEIAQAIERECQDVRSDDKSLYGYVRAVIKKAAALARRVGDPS